MSAAHIISLQIQGGDWKNQLTQIEKFVEETALAVLMLGWFQKHQVELSVVLADDAFVQKLNGRYRNQHKATNVLSFPTFEEDPSRMITAVTGPPVLLGDVVLAFETCVTESLCIKSASQFSDHTRHLLVHGILHLLGHNHEEDIEAGRMTAIEKQVLARFGVTDPY